MLLFYQTFLHELMNMLATVLIVDDDPTLVNLYQQYLQPEFSVRTAYSGAQALEQCDDSIDVVLLDRQMPGINGQEVLEKIKKRDLNCQIAMVTAVKPTIDVIDMPFDTYLLKPVSKDELQNTVQTLLARDTYEETVQDTFSIASKIGLLETELPNDELEDNPTYRAYKADLQKQQDVMEDIIQKLDDESFRTAFHAIDS